MMNRSLFITGATGFIGRRLLERVKDAEFSALYCLTRSEEAPAIHSATSGMVRFIRGDLAQPERFHSCLQSVDAVIHLAATTGKATPGEYFRVNREGTRRLVEACAACGVKKILHVSTISVKYPEDGNYHYGLSKRQAEDIVAASGLSYTIVRPTIVLGEESPPWKNLSSLGRRSPIFLPGNGRAKIQPVHVDDLVDCLLEIVRQDLFPREICEVGGRDIVSMEDFLKKVHRCHFKRDPYVFHIPLGVILPPLRFADRFLPSLLPFNSGQFAAFKCDGVVESNPKFERCVSAPRGVEEIIGELAGKEKPDCGGPLNRECEVFSRYLLGRIPDEYILRKYMEANRDRSLSYPPADDRFESRLLRVASISPALTKLADAFSAVFAKRSLLRKKLVLLIAILESSGAAGELVGPEAGKGRGVTWLSLFGRGISFLVSFLLSIVLFLPLAVLSKFGTTRPAR